jgi:hypothetical protein
VIGYDKGDPFYDSLHGQSQVVDWFERSVKGPLAGRGIDISLLTVQVNNVLKKPGPVFNAMLRGAYDADAEYFFRVNDDSEMRVPWASKFVSQLMAMGEPYGVVGPVCRQGNGKILTHDFVHRRHLEIFGPDTYYPADLTDWWMDDWISRVYGSLRTRRGDTVEVVHHTHHHGQRYQVDRSHAKLLPKLVAQGHAKIVAFMRAKGLPGSAVSLAEKDRTNGPPYTAF